ncbi:transcriptional regulator [Marmoricola endophyticus]|uniref:Transcriptional regulator n=1 Tax=Marmoricola endophyticus TaxID=2040280 RepID=A0A917EYR6_9ACTN|nr:helix-turn-helix transcriptional regulator [Marmoricola endophyticus]GGF31624.1 transcriptional regulator [Marmoricola endophyticus]
MVLFREELGRVLRAERVEQEMTLRQLSARARVSLGYISEIERGHKEASSELLASLCSALDLPLSRLLGEVTDSVAAHERRTIQVSGQVATLPAVPARAGEPVSSAA